MPEFQGRERLRPWLTTHIASGRVPGLEWVNVKEQIFKIPWKHSSKHDWNESDSLIFKMWAQHTGRYQEGEKEDWPGWKTRFRCALNKLPDFEEVKKLNKLDGIEPYKVYRIVPKTDLSPVLKQQQNTSTKRPIRCYMRDTLVSENTVCRTEGQYEAQNTVPLSVAMVMGSSTDHIKREISDETDDLQKKCKAERNVQSLGSDLKDLDMKDLIYTKNNLGIEIQPSQKMMGLANADEEMDCSDSPDENLVVDEEIYPTDDQTGAPAVNRENMQYNPNNCSAIGKLKTELMLNDTQPHDHALSIKFCYRQKEVGTHNVFSPRGCRLYFGNGVQKNVTDPFGKELFGDPEAEQVEIPYIQGAFLSGKHQQLTIHLLSSMERGIVLHCENRDIYATRYSKCTIFVASPMNNEVVKLKRDGSSMKIFDYNYYFYPAIQRYLSGTGPKPSADIILGFGQQFSMEKSPYSDLLLSATIYHELAHYQLNQVNLTSPMSPSIQLSKPDSLDKLMCKQKEYQTLQQTNLHAL